MCYYLGRMFVEGMSKMRNKVELQYESQFKQYLSRITENQRVISDCISRCKRVQIYEGDLVKHYTSDEGKTLLEKLSYSMEEAKRGINPRHSIQFKGTKGYKSIYEGTHSLNTAVRHYFDFMREF